MFRINDTVSFRRNSGALQKAVINEICNDGLRVAWIENGSIVIRKV